jgi:hypothetical protein
MKLRASGYESGHELSQKCNRRVVRALEPLTTLDLWIKLKKTHDFLFNRCRKPNTRGLSQAYGPTLQYTFFEYHLLCGIISEVNTCGANQGDDYIGRATAKLGIHMAHNQGIDHDGCRALTASPLPHHLEQSHKNRYVTHFSPPALCWMKHLETELLSSARVSS